MDRQAQEYAAAMAYAQQQQQQQQQFGFHPPSQQYPQQMHGPPFIPPHPSVQQYPPYHRPMPPQGQFYPQHHVPPHVQQGPPFVQPTAHLMSPPPYMHPLDSTPPVAAPPPADPELHKRIDKLVEYIAKNGPEFEALIREKQHDNPEYGFLFGGEGYSYYKYILWMSTRAPSAPFNSPYPPSSLHNMPPTPNILNAHLGAVGGPPGSMLGGPQFHQPPYTQFYDQHQQPPQPYIVPSRTEYELASTKSFKGLSGPLPSDVAAELSDVLSNLNGTKESIKGAKVWFMQRSPFAPALAEALRERLYSLDDSERQLHIIFLANDILFESLLRRITPRDLDNEALAFKPVLGSMLARVYNNPQNIVENQARLEKILQFWGAKEVYDPDTIAQLESEMTGLPVRSAVQREAQADFSGSQPGPQLGKSPNMLENDVQSHLAPAALSKSTPPTPLATAQLPAITGAYPPIPQAAPFIGSLANQPTLAPLVPQAVSPAIPDQNPPPYPLFPPGLIPGMVKKMQIGSGVPYSPLSPLDIPTAIPPSTVTQSEILDSVAKFFKEIGEVNPSDGPLNTKESDDYGDYEHDLPVVRRGGACIPPPPTLQVDPETGMYADGSVDSKPGSGRLGLGATADPDNMSQYDDVYSSYRKQRSNSYHTSMSAKAGSR